MIRQYELVEKVSAYDPGTDEELLNRAYVFSMMAHGTQTRASGDPYFSHPLEVAGILTEYRLDCATIVTALLHDTVEDTVATLEQIENLFGLRGRASRRVPPDALAARRVGATQFSRSDLHLLPE